LRLRDQLLDDAGGVAMLEIERDVAGPIRDVLAERLVKVGFDENYEPNEEGKFLEDLIDRLFVP